MTPIRTVKPKLSKSGKPNSRGKTLAKKASPVLKESIKRNSGRKPSKISISESTIPSVSTPLHQATSSIHRLADKLIGRPKRPKRPPHGLEEETENGTQYGDSPDLPVHSSNDTPRTVLHLRVPAKRNDSAQRDSRTDQARLRLGVTPEQLRGVPRITHILSKAAGGIFTVIAALRLSTTDEAVQFLDKYDSVSESDMERLSIEEICVAANVAPKRLLELAVSSLMEDSQSSGAIIAATYHPQVIEATAREALESWGVDEKRMFLSGSGFLPSTKGGGNVSVRIENRNAALTTGNSDSPPSDLPPGLGPRDHKVFNFAEEELLALHGEIDGKKLLLEPSPPLSDIEAEVELECIPKPPSDAVGRQSFTVKPR